MEKFFLDGIAWLFNSSILLRYTFAAIALLIVAYILYKNRNEASLNSTIDAYKEEVIVKDLRIATLIEQIKKCDEQVKTTNVEIAALKAKTDLSEIMLGLKSVGEAVNKEHTYNIEANKQKIVILEGIVQTIQLQQTENTALLKQIYDNTCRLSRRSPKDIKNV